MSLIVNGCLGVSDFGNGSHCSKCAQRRSFLRHYWAHTGRCDQTSAYCLRTTCQAICELESTICFSGIWTTPSLGSYLLWARAEIPSRTEVGSLGHVIDPWPKVQMDLDVRGHTLAPLWFVLGFGDESRSQRGSSCLRNSMGVHWAVIEIR